MPPDPLTHPIAALTDHPVLSLEAEAALIAALRAGVAAQAAIAAAPPPVDPALLHQAAQGQAARATLRSEGNYASALLLVCTVYDDEAHRNRRRRVHLSHQLSGHLTHRQKTRRIRLRTGLRNTQAPRDLAVALPVGSLIRDQGSIRRRLESSAGIERP